MERLKPHQAADVRAGVARHLERAEAKEAESGQSRMEVLREELREEVEAEVTPLMDDLFRAAESRWAGGETSNSVTIGTTPRA